MRKLVLLLLVILLLAGCSNKGNAGAVNNTVPNNSTSDSVKFTDSIFEKYFRLSINKLDGDLSKDELSAVKQLKLDNGDFKFSYQPYEMIQRETVSESGKIYYIIENNSKFNVVYKILTEDKKEIIKPSTTEDLKLFTGLEYLEVSSWPPGEWPLYNFEFVKYMPEIKYIKVEQSPHDLTPLKNCSKLEYLGLDFSQVTDFSVFSEMDSIKHIEIIDGYTETESKIKENLKSDDVNFIY